MVDLLLVVQFLDDSSTKVFALQFQWREQPHSDFRSLRHRDRLTRDPPPQTSATMMTVPPSMLLPDVRYPSIFFNKVKLIQLLRSGETAAAATTEKIADAASLNVCFLRAPSAVSSR